MRLDKEKSGSCDHIFIAFKPRVIEVYEGLEFVEFKETLSVLSINLDGKWVVFLEYGVYSKCVGSKTNI